MAYSLSGRRGGGAERKTGRRGDGERGRFSPPSVVSPPHRLTAPPPHMEFGSELPAIDRSAVGEVFRDDLVDRLGGEVVVEDGTRVDVHRRAVVAAVAA